MAKKTEAAAGKHISAEEYAEGRHVALTSDGAVITAAGKKNVTGRHEPSEKYSGGKHVAPGPEQKAAAGKHISVGRYEEGKRVAAASGDPAAVAPKQKEAAGKHLATGRYAEGRHLAAALTSGAAAVGAAAPEIPEEQNVPTVRFIPSLEETEKERERLQYRKRYRKTLRNTFYTLVVVVAVTILIATMFFPILQVSGSSMEPTLENGDVVILFNRSGFETGDLVGFYFQNQLLLKRVIAGPGDIIYIDQEGNVYVNEEPLYEPYITNKSIGETDRTYPYQVPESRYFVMGDNRLTSIDSRSTSIGCIETDQIVGKVVLRVWPLSRISIIR